MAWQTTNIDCYFSFGFVAIKHKLSVVMEVRKKIKLNTIPRRNPRKCNKK